MEQDDNQKFSVRTLIAKHPVANPEPESVVPDEYRGPEKDPLAACSPFTSTGCVVEFRKQWRVVVGGTFSYGWSVLSTLRNDWL